MSGTSGLIGRRIQANVYYTDKRGVNHAIKVKTAVLATSGGCNIEIEPDEAWKEATLHNGIVLCLHQIGQKLPDKQMPVAKAVAHLVNELHIRALHAESAHESLLHDLLSLKKRFFVRLSLWLKPL